MRPVCQILIDGQAASGTLMERMISCAVTDEEGISADRVEIELNDDPPAQIPRVGAVISVSMGYQGALSFMGEFTAEEVEVGLRPNIMRITGKSADLGGDAKDQKERHWDDVTLGALVVQIAAEHGLKASIDPALADFRYDWIGQVQESDPAFLERLARRHNTLFAIKAGTVLFTRRGSGLAPSGADLTPLVITPGILVEGSACVAWSSRAKYGEVVACYMDRSSGTRQEVRVVLRPDGPDEGNEPEGEGAFMLDQPFASEAEARAAANAKARDLRRSEVTFAADIVGDPAARGGGPVVFSGVRPGVDGIQFIAETAIHTISAKGAYTTSLTGSLKA